MRFRVLGTLELAAAGGEPALLRSAKLRTLLAVLLVRAGDVVSTDQLADVLWDDAQPVHAADAVHNLVSRLRTAMGSCGASDGVELRTHAPGYLLQVGEAAVDATRFAQLVEDARARLSEAPQVAAALLDEALGMWRGPAYAEFADQEFARPEAARLEELRLAAVGDRVDAALALGRHDEAMARLGAVVADHPLLPRPRAQLMLARHRAGRSSEALEVYRDLLGEELGLDPSTELRALEAAIIRQDPRLDWSPPVSPGGNLPLALAELVGRDDDATRVTHALERARLITLTGIGGVGKTRLALHVAGEVAAHHPDGAWLCELAPVGADAVADVLASVLGVQQRAGLTVTQRLAEYLRAKRLLLVVDNCEHVSAAAGRLLDALVRACPHIRVLATSREPLDLDGEQVLPVAPLPVPPQDSNPDEVAAVASVALFAQRAASALPSFRLTTTNASDVAEICRRLDGLPLALELVAPKVRSFTAAEIVARLDRRLHFVRTAGGIREQRHRTLRAVVEWSYRLLAESERQIFDRLSVFAGSFTLDAAERVVAGDLDPPEVADIVPRLVDRSLLTAQCGQASTRYRMLETLRHYGRERLDARGEANHNTAGPCHLPREAGGGLGQRPNRSESSSLDRGYRAAPGRPAGHPPVDDRTGPRPGDAAVRRAVLVCGVRGIVRDRRVGRADRDRSQRRIGDDWPGVASSADDSAERGRLRGQQAR